MITVGLVEDHTALRAGLSLLLKADKNIAVCIEVDNGLELFKALSSTKERPDIIVLDLHMPKISGIETLDRLQVLYPEIKVIIYSFLANKDMVKNAISRGARSFLCKATDTQMLFKAIYSVYNDGYFVNDLAKMEYLKSPLQQSKKNGFNGQQFLTSLELQFIQLSSTDLQIWEIAKIMNKKPRTIENYRDNLFRKLSIKSRAALVGYAYQAGIIK